MIFKYTSFDLTSKKYVNLLSKCHNHEAQPSRGTKRRRDEEQIRIKTNSAYNHRRTNKEELLQGNRHGMVSRKTTRLKSHQPD